MATVLRNAPPVHSDPAADDFDPATWPDWTDADRFGIDLDCEPDDLAGWLAAEAGYYATLGTAAGRWLSAELAALAALAAALHAATPDQLDGRRQALEDDRDGRIEARGFADGHTRGVADGLLF